MTLLNVEKVLAQSGVKGMKWGVRKRDKTPTDVVVKTNPGRRVKAKGGKYHGASEDAIKAAIARQTARKSTVDSLSNQELQALVTRMNLEQQYSRLSADRMTAGQKFAKNLAKQADPEVSVHYLTKGAASVGKTVNPTVATAVEMGSIVARTVAGGGQVKKKK